MDVLNFIWQDIRLITIWDIIDILIVASLVFYLLKIVKDTAAAYLLKGVVVLFLVFMISSFLKLNIITFILRSIFQIGILAIIIVFQPELRTVLHKFGTSHHLRLFKSQDKTDYQAIRLTIAKTVEAVNRMSWDKVGALIVFEREDNISSVANLGTHIDAETSAELLKNIFYPKSPLHDGAVIISNGRIKAAGCILPLTANHNISKELGTRHRAALGMSETYDSIVVVVSEENSAISLASGGVLKRHLAPETLEKILCDELLPKVDNSEKPTIIDWLKGKVKG